MRMIFRAHSSSGHYHTADKISYVNAHANWIRMMNEWVNGMNAPPSNHNTRTHQVSYGMWYVDRHNWDEKCECWLLTVCCLRNWMHIQNVFGVVMPRAYASIGTSVRMRWARTKYLKWMEEYWRRWWNGEFASRDSKCARFSQNANCRDAEATHAITAWFFFVVV